MYVLLQVFFVDFGNIETVFEGAVYEMTEKPMMEIPPLAVPIVLSTGDESLEHLAVSKLIHYFDKQKIWLTLGKNQICCNIVFKVYVI